MIRKQLLPLMIIVAALPAWLTFTGCSTENTQNKQAAQETANIGDEAEKQQAELDRQPVPGPSEELDGIFLLEKSYNFGVVTRGDKMTHKFVLRNTGDAPLQILKAKAG